jgi:hypothetical protein
MTHGALRRAYPLDPQQVSFRLGAREINSVRALRAATNLRFQRQDGTVSFETPGIVDYEVVALF